MTTVITVSVTLLLGIILINDSITSTVHFIWMYAFIKIAAYYSLANELPTPALLENGPYNLDRNSIIWPSTIKFIFGHTL